MFGRLLLTLFGVIVAVTALAQSRSDAKTWHVIIADAADGNGIAKATIRLGTAVFISDNQGYADIVKAVINKADTIKVSCIAYNTLSLPLAGNYPDTLKLTIAQQMLKTIKVSAINRKTPDTAYTGGYLLTVDNEIAEYVPNPKHLNGIISSVDVKLLGDHAGLKMPFKINVYTEQTDGFYPADTLIRDSIIVENPSGRHLVSVDISRYQLQFPTDGIIVSFQTLSRAWYIDHNFAIVGKEYYLLPGIKGVWKNRDYKIDNTYRPGERYSLRRIAGDDTWSKFEYGTNFSIGVTIDTGQ